MAYEKRIFSTFLLILAIGYCAGQGNTCSVIEVTQVSTCFGPLVALLGPILSQVCSPTQEMCLGFSSAVECLNALTLEAICRDSLPAFIDTQLGSLQVSECNFILDYIYIQCPTTTRLAQSAAMPVQLSLIGLFACVVIAVQRFV